MENSQTDLFDLFSDEYAMGLLEDAIQHLPERIWVNLSKNQRKRIDDLTIRWVDLTSSLDYSVESQTALGVYASNLNTVWLIKQNIEKCLSSEKSKKTANVILFMVVYHEVIHALYPRTREHVIQSRTKKWLKSHVRELQASSDT